MGLKGERVRLVPSEASLHLENALRWMNDPEVTARLDHLLGVTRRQEEAFFERIETQREHDLHWAILAEDGRTSASSRSTRSTGAPIRHRRTRDRRAGRLGPGLRQRRGPGADPLRLRAARPASDRGAHDQPRDAPGLREMRVPPRRGRPAEDRGGTGGGTTPTCSRSWKRPLREPTESELARAEPLSGCPEGDDCSRSSRMRLRRSTSPRRQLGGGRDRPARL